ncbi:hypothetical protein [Micromonospora okii]|uniref:hypothetical protein n=1 Tax=Micromonospora okii TaxID=1182970 RepID=UPI001E289748|nr:hypothetical protein [Micromonospora okii]
MPDSVPSTEDEVLERLEDEIAFLAENLAVACGEIDELAYELDDHLAENDLERVESAVNQLEGLLDEEVAGDLVSLARLCAVRDGHPADEDRNDPPVPTLTADELPPFVPDQDQEDEDEARIDNLRERMGTVADHLRSLFSFTSDRFGSARTAAEHGYVGRSLSELRLARKAAAEVPPGYKLWMRCLNDLYLVSPSSLGAYGHMLMDFEAFLQAERPGRASG